MRFSYASLAKSAKNGEQLGRWHGKPVFAASHYDLETLGTGCYYIVYDADDLYVVKRDYQDRFYAYGTMDWNGSVDEWGTSELYLDFSEKIPDPEPAPSVIGDVKLEIDVEKVLKSAREMTVDSLLEGFNYGL